MWNSSNLSEEGRELRDRISQDNEVLGKAYKMKESLCSVYLLDDVYAAEDCLKGWMALSKLGRFVRLAKTVGRHI